MTDQVIIKLDMAGQVPGFIRLLPVGEVKLTDGRPPFLVDYLGLEEIVAAWRQGGNDLPIDYEHQSLSGEAAPAAGWIKGLEFAEDGLWATVEWTAKAREFLANREYRYFSPVVALDDERRAVKLLHAGLTNTPAISSLTPLVLAVSVDRVDARVNDPNIWIKEKEAGKAMLEKLKSLYAAEEGAGEEQLLALAGKHKEAFLAMTEFSQILDLQADAGPGQVKAAILALKQGGDRLAVVETELTALKGALLEGEVQKAVSGALAAGKVTPAQKEWAEAYARKDLEGFQIFVAKAPAIVTPGQKYPDEPTAGQAGLTEPELAMAQQLGVTPEAFKAQREQMAKQA